MDLSLRPSFAIPIRSKVCCASPCKTNFLLHIIAGSEMVYASFQNLSQGEEAAVLCHSIYLDQ